MLPSDHFVRMYNEAFKMIGGAGKDDLKEYWLAISRLQEGLLGPYIEQSGLEGMYAYWDRIRIEEKCEMELILKDDCLEVIMKRCPSLAKNLDNDAGLCRFYCDHCPGWINPLVRKYGYYPVYNIISRICLIPYFLT